MRSRHPRGPLPDGRVDPRARWVFFTLHYAARAKAGDWVRWKCLVKRVMMDEVW